MGSFAGCVGASAQISASCPGADRLAAAEMLWVHLLLLTLRCSGYVWYISCDINCTTGNTDLQRKDSSQKTSSYLRRKEQSGTG